MIKHPIKINAEFDKGNGVLSLDRDQLQQLINKITNQALEKKERNYHLGVERIKTLK